MAAPPEVQRVLEQLQSELLRMVEANEIGTLTVHCGATNLVVEINRKLDPVQRERKAKVPARANW